MLAIYILKRLIQMVPVLLGVTIIIFSIVHLIPGDPAEIILGPDATKEDVEAFRESLGLNKPIYIQYYIFFKNLMRGNLGQSIRFNRPVFELIMEKLPATIELAFAAMIVIFVISFPVGILSAVKQDTLYDHAGMTGALMGISVANFWLGIMLILVFSGYLGILPSGGRVDSDMAIYSYTRLFLLDYLLARDFRGFANALIHIALPAFTLGVGFSAMTTRIIRTSMLEVLRQDYITTARSKGLIERVVILIHALKNALIPVVTIIALQIGTLLGGVVVIETVFSWPGIGSLLITGITSRDYMLVQGIVLVFAFIWNIINLITDVTYSFIDPRILYK